MTLAVSKRRPSRSDLEALIPEMGGNISKLTTAGIAHGTAYTWIYQLGLDKLAGIATLPIAPRPVRSVVDGPRPVTMKLPASLHRWIGIHAIDTDRTVSAIRPRPWSCSGQSSSARSRRAPLGGPAPPWRRPFGALSPLAAYFSLLLAVERRLAPCSYKT